MPNPDFESKESYAVAPKEKELTVYHTNAIRLEKADAASPARLTHCGQCGQCTQCGPGRLFHRFARSGPATRSAAGRCSTR